MNIRNLTALGTTAAFVLLAGCSDDETETPASTTTSSTTSSTTGAGGEGTGGEGGGGGAGGGAAATADVRVAHLSSDAPAVDVCVTADGATWVGPVMKSLGATDGLAFQQVTGYLALPAATYTARLVAPNAADCETSLAGLPDVPGLAVAEGGSYTVAAIGALAPTGNEEAFRVTAFVDDADVASGKAKLRFVHASADTPNVDVGTGEGASFSAVFTDVAFGTVGKVGGKDYLETDPLTDVTISARATGTTTDALVLPGVSLPAGAIATAFAIGNLDGTPSPLAVLVCVDNGSPAANLTPCSVLP